MTQAPLKSMSAVGDSLVEAAYVRRCFREENANLLSVEYWRDAQQKLPVGDVARDDPPRRSQ